MYIFEENRDFPLKFLAFLMAMTLTFTSLAIIAFIDNLLFEKVKEKDNETIYLDKKSFDTDSSYSSRWVYLKNKRTGRN